MSAKEMFVALKSCLHGSRKRIYENIMKRNPKGSLMTEELSKEVHDEVKSRLMRFTETIMERQFRLRREWAAMAKTKHMTALQFEAGWEELLAGLEEAGLAKTEREVFFLPTSRSSARTLAKRFEGTGDRVQMELADRRPVKHAYGKKLMQS